MKPYLLALGLLLAGTSASAQQAAPGPLTVPVDAATQQITYSGIIDVPGATKDELYARGKIWFGAAFYSTQSVILADDQPAGFLVGRGFSTTGITFELIPIPTTVRVLCTIKLAFKDGKYRYTLTEFQLKGEPEAGLGPQQSHLPRASAEQVCLETRSNGTPTKRAAKFSQGLDQAAQRLVASIELGMSKAARDNAW